MKHCIKLKTKRVHSFVLFFIYEAVPLVIYLELGFKQQQQTKIWNKDSNEMFRFKTYIKIY